MQVPLHIFHISLRIYYITEFPNVTSSGGGCTRESWNYPLGPGLGILAHIIMGVPNPIYRHISSYFFIFSTYFFIFSRYFFIFLVYFFILFFTYSFIFSTYSIIFPSYFLHIYYINEFVIRVGGRGEGCTRESRNYLLGPRLEIFQSPPNIFSNGHFPECDVIRKGVSGGGVVLANPDIT